MKNREVNKTHCGKATIPSPTKASDKSISSQSRIFGRVPQSPEMEIGKEETPKTNIPTEQQGKEGKKGMHSEVTTDSKVTKGDTQKNDQESGDPEQKALGYSKEESYNPKRQKGRINQLQNLKEKTF